MHATRPIGYLHPLQEIFSSICRLSLWEGVEVDEFPRASARKEDGVVLLSEYEAAEYRRARLKLRQIILFVENEFN